MLLEDTFQRKFKTLRVSLLDVCNLACVYCTMGGDEQEKINRSPQQSASHFAKLIGKLHGHLNFETIRLTGGEPLLFREIIPLIKSLKNLGIPQIKMTSNGTLLKQKAADLKHAGLQCINVSLDAVEDAAFFKVSKRKNLKQTLDGIDSALDCGLDVKINSVIMRGMNDDQLLPLLDFAFERNIAIRFLEIMAMGHLYNQSEKYFFSQTDMLEKISMYYQITPMPRKSSSTANYWKTSHGNTFGIIANNSHPFCGDCNRLRMDSFGNLFGCLSSNHPISFSGDENDETLRQNLQLAMNQKQTFRFTGSDMSMLHIGG
ncbi:GTP 3',8-cyclase MoaA [Hufsiella arboris]|nr:GTP 3',8-cyclase MoaA [Hufsiella arboris]